MYFSAANPFYPMAPWGGYWGLGDAASDAQIIQAGGAIATPVVTGVLASSAASSAAAGGSGLILGMTASVAVPVIGAAIAGAVLAITYLVKNSGCGPTCVVTSQWADQASQLLDQNIKAYFSQPAPRSRAQQAASLAGFDQVLNYLVQNCSQASLGNAGKRCISDRQAGACTWKALAPAYPGQPAIGECWNWFNAYRDPIANDPNVVDTPESDAVVQSINQALGLGSTFPIGLVLGAALIGLGLWALL